MPFLYISNGLNEAQEETTFLSQPAGVEQSILLESGLARSIVSRVIRTLHFASCIVAGKKQCVNIIKKKITWSIFETVIILLACVSVTILCLKLSVFSQLLQLNPNLIGEFVWLATTSQKQGTEIWLSQFQACTSPSGICRAFVILFWKSYKCPTVGLNNRVQMAYPGQHQNCVFQ